MPLFSDGNGSQFSQKIFNLLTVMGLKERKKGLKPQNAVGLVGVHFPRSFPPLSTFRSDPKACFM